MMNFKEEINKNSNRETQNSQKYMKLEVVDVVMFS